MSKLHTRSLRSSGNEFHTGNRKRMTHSYENILRWKGFLEWEVSSLEWRSEWVMDANEKRWNVVFEN